MAHPSKIIPDATDKTAYESCAGTPKEQHDTVRGSEFIAGMHAANRALLYSADIDDAKRV